MKEHNENLQEREDLLLQEFPQSMFCKKSLDILRHFSDWNESAVRKEIEVLDYVCLAFFMFGVSYIVLTHFI